MTRHSNELACACGAVGYVLWSDSGHCALELGRARGGLPSDGAVLNTQGQQRVARVHGANVDPAAPIASPRP
jgi:hypothetical protein